ncbi:hypothetical protein MVEN_00184700 [Mycena venus]|uniref:F-box domain-containing protein n=1 Tax=Mycena venus TaxID=2733690 RepID=A0A8H7DDY0_9AGAR|nr:hypothetical protein MVEN_00184700 [Mycena venus]
MSTTTTIPQELVDSIIGKVDGTESLKACSLVCWNFRRPSQRILLRSLTLDDYTPRYSAAYVLLTESPHIARYVRNLTVRLTWVAISAPSDAEDFLRMLEKLTSVDRFAIAAHCTWDALSPVVSAVLNLIQRGRLEELHFSFIEKLPRSVLALSLTSVSALSFNHVIVDESTEVPDDGLPAAKTLQTLTLFNCSGLDAVLARQEFRTYLANLRILRLGSHPGFSSDVMSIAGPTLEHILFDCSGLVFSSPMRSLPPLAKLRSIDFQFPINHFYEDGFTAMLSQLFSTLPESVSEISVSDSSPTSPLELQLLNAATSLDRMLGKRAGRLSLRWRLNFPKDEKGLACLRSFAETVQRRMPTLHEKGELTVERRDDARKWPPRL